MSASLRLHRSTVIFTVLLLLAAFATVACAPQGEGGGEAAEPEAAAADAGDGAPRVFFIDPTDGATIPPLYNFRFGAENFAIAPVVEGENPPGEGHFHIGLDTECLPAGVVIPTADPWIHFGDGSAQIEIQLEPGPHTIALQIGDGEHRTLPDEGLCQVITVTVAEDAAEDEAAGAQSGETN